METIGFPGFPNASAALNLTTTSARVLIPGGVGPLLLISISAVVTAVRVGINLGDVTVVAALPASGSSTAGMIMPAGQVEFVVRAPHGVTHIAGITDAGTCQIGVGRVGG